MLKKEKIEGIRYEKVEVFHSNPKSINMGQLYGMFDPNTNEWQDGILAGIVRQAAKGQSISEVNFYVIKSPKK